MISLETFNLLFTCICLLSLLAVLIFLYIDSKKPKPHIKKITLEIETIKKESRNVMRESKIPADPSGNLTKDQIEALYSYEIAVKYDKVNNKNYFSIYNIICYATGLSEYLAFDGNTYYYLRYTTNKNKLN